VMLRALECGLPLCCARAAGRVMCVCVQEVLLPVRGLDERGSNVCVCAGGSTACTGTR
jgi:hypothetical protein